MKQLIKLTREPPFIFEVGKISKTMNGDFFLCYFLTMLNDFLRCFMFSMMISATKSFVHCALLFQQSICVLFTSKSFAEKTKTF